MGDTYQVLHLVYSIMLEHIDVLLKYPLQYWTINLLQ